MKIVFLGTGGSWPSPERNVSAIAIKRNAEVLLFDCGEGTQRQLMHSTVSFMQISKIFITHFHGDHFLGLAGLIQSMSLNNRDSELEIYGPDGCEILIDSMTGLGHYTTTYPIITKDVKPGDIIKFDDYKVRVAQADHPVPALMYSLEENPRPGKFDKPKALELGIPEGRFFSQLQQGKIIEHDGKSFTPDMVLGPPRPGRKIVYTGDTKPTQEIVKLAKNCDVLIHDSTTALDLEEKSNSYGHSSSAQAAQAAKDAGAVKLFLTHISPRYDETEQLLADAVAIFENSEVPDDFTEYEVKYKNEGI